jgi:hypothetical protein
LQDFALFCRFSRRTLKDFFVFYSLFYQLLIPIPPLPRQKRLDISFFRAILSTMNGRKNETEGKEMRKASYQVQERIRLNRNEKGTWFKMGTCKTRKEAEALAKAARKTCGYLFPVRVVKVGK